MVSTLKGQWRYLVAVLIIALSFTGVGSASAQTFPELIPLPNGFAPEGIASGKGTTFFVGSIPTGAIYKGDLRTGEGDILVESQAGRAAIGLKYDPRSGLLFVAGGMTGYAYIYDAETGENYAEIQLSPDPSFINDVTITQEAAYFTNSFQPVIHRVALSRNGIPSTAGVETIRLGGDYQFTPGTFNANGIAATPNGRTLIIVNSTEGALYTVDPASGDATRVDLGGGSVQFGDGILLQGKTLYVVQNQLNQVAVVELGPHYTSGAIVDTISSPFFRVPTTIAGFGHSLYVVNARFGTPVTPDTEYEVVRVPDA